MLSRIKNSFTESIQTQIAAAEMLPDVISQAAMMIVQALLNGNKVLACGQGTSGVVSSMLAAKLVNRFSTERPSLPAISLNADHVVTSAIMKDNHFEEIYAKQVRAFGLEHDVLVVFSTQGQGKDILKAVEAGVMRGLTIIALTGGDGGELAGLLGQNDVEIRIPSGFCPRVEEMYMLIINCLCDLIDYNLFPQQER